MFGGGMRQAGVIAAAGLIALEKSPGRLHADHENAQLLAKGIAAMPGLKIDPAKVRTNIVIFDCEGRARTRWSCAICCARRRFGRWIRRRIRCGL